MSELPKPTVDRVKAGARAQRDGKTEEEWLDHLLRTARTQAKILNTVVEHEGPEGLEFRMQVRTISGGSRSPGRWVDVEDTEDGGATPDRSRDRCQKCGHFRKAHRSIEKHGKCSWHSPWFCHCTGFEEPAHPEGA